MTERTLGQWLHDLEYKNKQEIQLGLERVLEAAKRLDLLSPECVLITVAGTNGKGSTVTALEHLYDAGGFTVGTYTSPHLIDFNERIRINKQTIADEALCRIFSDIEQQTLDLSLTYFEMTTLAALVYFKQNKVQVMLLEVGLGGRLDAVNILNADLAIITGIDYDHQELLGNTLDAIAYEKAGILRSEKPFIYADTHPAPSLITQVKALSIPAYYYREDFSYTEQGDLWTLHYLNQTLESLPKPKIQVQSAAAAILATILLHEQLPLSKEHIIQAMNTIFIPGRLQLEPGDVSVLYDVSHNPQSAGLLAKKVKALNIKGKVHAVFSALKDKDIFGIINPLRDCVDLWYPAQLDQKRACSPEQLLSVLADAEIFVDICYNTPFTAFKEALNQAKSGDLIIVYGSFYTVGQLLAAQRNS